MEGSLRFGEVILLMLLLCSAKKCLRKSKNADKMHKVDNQIAHIKTMTTQVLLRHVNLITVHLLSQIYDRRSACVFCFVPE